MLNNFFGCWSDIFHWKAFLLDHSTTFLALVCVCSMSLTISLGYVKTSKPQNTCIKYKCCPEFSLSRACFYVSRGFSSLYCCNMVAMFKIETTIKIFWLYIKRWATYCSMNFSTISLTARSPKKLSWKSNESNNKIDKVRFMKWKG